MMRLPLRLSAIAWWLVPVAGLAALIGWETHWGSAIVMEPKPAAAIEPKPIVASVLPEFAIPGGVEARSETVARTLFNPTRRPAPTVTQESAGQRLKPGQFTLTGTMLVDGTSVAFLRETEGNKPRNVKAGETINGMRVAEVKADRVRLTLGEESEELVLKVATNPRPTPQPVAAVAQPPSAPAARAAAAATAAGAAPGTEAQKSAAQTLAERRRAARAAQAAAVAAPVAPPATAAGQATPIDPQWQQLDQAYRERAAGRTQ